MTPQPAELWLAEIRFTDASGAKIRPVLILWLDGPDAVVAAVTAAAPRSPMDVLLVDWRPAGLRKPSTVRLSRLDCLEQVLLLKRLGILSTDDRGLIRNAWANHVKPQF